ncbi:MAG: SH3 domain-containing protein [Alphaproteobacteria bacterium]
MRYALFIAAAVMALSAVVTVPAHAYEAAYGQASGAANVRSGPSDKYEIIGKVGSGAKLHIIGCSRTWEWCDVKTSDKRGWMAARFLLGNYENNLAGVINYGSKMGIPEIAFEERVYWGTHYAHTYFYKKRYGMHEPVRARVVTSPRYVENARYVEDLNHSQPVVVEQRTTTTTWRDARFVPNNTVRINN